MPKQENFVSFPLRLSEEVERLFEEMIHRPWGFVREMHPWNPSVDLYETPDAYVLEADLPGVKAEDVKVEVQNSILVLRGKRSLEQVHSTGTFIFMERGCGDFVRRIRLPESVSKDKIQAEFHDGVLRVILPKIRKGEQKHGTGSGS